MRFIGAKLREVREARNLSQEDLARRAEVALGSIKNWEKRATKPRDEAAIERLCRVLGIHPSILFDFGGQFFEQEVAPHDPKPAA